jgi:hypothetical protein
MGCQIGGKRFDEDFIVVPDEVESHIFGYNYSSSFYVLSVQRGDVPAVLFGHKPKSVTKSFEISQMKFFMNKSTQLDSIVESNPWISWEEVRLCRRTVQTGLQLIGMNEWYGRHDLVKPVYSFLEKKTALTKVLNHRLSYILRMTRYMSNELSQDVSVIKVGLNATAHTCWHPLHLGHFLVACNACLPPSAPRSSAPIAAHFSSEFLFSSWRLGVLCL